MAAMVAELAVGKTGSDFAAIATEEFDVVDGFISGIDSSSNHIFGIRYDFAGERERERVCWEN